MPLIRAGLGDDVHHAFRLFDTSEVKSAIQDQETAFSLGDIGSVKCRVRVRAGSDQRLRRDPFYHCRSQPSERPAEPYVTKGAIGTWSRG